MDDERHFDPSARAAAKAAARQRDMEDLAAGRVTRSELARRNSLFGGFSKDDFDKMEIVSPPRTKIRF